MVTKVPLGTQTSGTSDDITEGSVNLFLSAADQAKLDNVPSDTNTSLSGKQETLVSWTNIKTINSTSLLWSGNIAISGTWTVTDISVVTANGISWTIATSTTTPAITLDISALDASKIADGTVSSAEFQYLNWVTSSIQTQINAKWSGDVVWPASATDNAIARFDSTTGKLIQNSAATIADTTGDITAGKYNTVAISGTSTPTLAVTGTTTVSGANTGDQTATTVSNTPAGNIAATTVQAAINELDTEKEPVITTGTTSQYIRGDKSLSTFANDVAAITLLTGIISGGVPSLNVDTTKIDISPAVYYIQGVKYTYAGITGLSPSFGVGQNSRRFGLDSSGLVQQATNFTNTQKQTILPIARVNTVQGSTGAGSAMIPPLDTRFLISEIGYLQRIWQEEAIGVLYASGGTIYESATPLQVSELAGVFYDAQRKRQIISGSSNIQAIKVYHSGGAWTTSTKATLVVDVLQYDNLTNLTTLSNNKWASHTILKSPKNSDEFFFVYSQAEYASQADAEAALPSYGVFIDQATSWLVAVAEIIVQKSAVNINKIVDIRPFIGGSVGSTLGTSNLQQTYDNSTTPEIVIDATRWALSIKRGSAADTDCIIEGLNGAGSQTSCIDGNGKWTFTSVALGTGSLTLTGSIGATGARATKVWATDIESTNMPTVGGVPLINTADAYIANRIFL